VKILNRVQCLEMCQIEFRLALETNQKVWVLVPEAYDNNVWGNIYRSVLFFIVYLLGCLCQTTY